MLQGNIELNLSCKLHLSIHHYGFLTHGSEIGGFIVWNRKWCVLEGHVLKFWNYPREQESASPLFTIDLMLCTNDEVSTIDRRLCAKPRTILVETVLRLDEPSETDNKRNPIIRNLLSCDNTADLQEWMIKLNQIMAALREWNVIVKRKPLEETDL